MYRVAAIVLALAAGYLAQVLQREEEDHRVKEKVKEP